MIIGISGLVLDRNGDPLRAEGAGKTSFASALVRYDFVPVACADLLKRMVRDLFGFSNNQVFGDISEKERVDPRYGFSPRYALQKVGTEVCREVYEDAWVNYAIKTARELLDHPTGRRYVARIGVIDDLDEPQYPIKGVAIHDIRFPNELRAIKKAGGYMVRVVRFSEEPPQQGLGHASSVSLLGVPNSEYDVIVPNTGTLRALYDEAGKALYYLRARQKADHFLEAR